MQYAWLYPKCRITFANFCWVLNVAPHVRSPSDYVRTQFSGFKLRCFLNFLTKKFKKHLNLKPGNSRSTMGFPELTCGAAPSTLHFSQDFGKRNSTGKYRSWPPLPAQLAQNAQNVNYLQHVGLAAALQCPIARVASRWLRYEECRNERPRPTFRTGP